MGTYAGGSLPVGSGEPLPPWISFEQYVTTVTGQADGIYERRGEGTVGLDSSTEIPERSSVSWQRRSGAFESGDWQRATRTTSSRSSTDMPEKASLSYKKPSASSKGTHTRVRSRNVGSKTLTASAKCNQATLASGAIGYSCSYEKREL